MGGAALTGSSPPPCSPPRAVAAAKEAALAPADRCRVDWREGDALALPFGDSEFSAVTCGYGLRNVADIPKALAEMHRVLKPGGKIAVLDFNNSSFEPVNALQGFLLDNLVRRRRLGRRCLPSVGAARGVALQQTRDAHGRRRRPGRPGGARKRRRFGVRVPPPLHRPLPQGAAAGARAPQAAASLWAAACCFRRSPAAQSRFPHRCRLRWRARLALRTLCTTSSPAGSWACWSGPAGGDAVLLRAALFERRRSGRARRRRRWRRCTRNFLCPVNIEYN